MSVKFYVTLKGLLMWNEVHLFEYLVLYKKQEAKKKKKKKQEASKIVLYIQNIMEVFSNVHMLLLFYNC